MIDKETKSMAINPAMSSYDRKLFGGGTLIRNAPVFSLDNEHVYVNCSWGVRVFSVNTGKCVKVLDTLSSDYGRVLSILNIDDKTAIVTRQDNYDIHVFNWNHKTSTIENKQQIILPNKYKNYKCSAVLLAPSYTNSMSHDICVVITDAIFQTKLKIEDDIHQVLFYDKNTLKILKHPLNGTKVGYREQEHLLSFGGCPDLRVMATFIGGKSFDIYSLDGRVKRNGIMAGDNLTWTSVCCHPTETYVALGDSIGRCVLLRNPLYNIKTKTIYHWHTLPCDVINFSPAGSTMFTGGGEHVLVKWNLENPHIKHFIPRLSAPIVHIVVSNDNCLLAVSTLDNGIIIVDSNYKIKSNLQQLSWGVLSYDNIKLFPAGLNFDKISRSIILNSKPGHLQFYCPETETCTTLDVCQQNYLTQERDKVIINADVTNVALSCDSVWMATVETRSDTNVSLELHLKLWEYDIPNRRWCLNSVVNMPHNGKVISLKFKPISQDNDNSTNKYLLVSTGEDSKFRLWSPTQIDNVYKNGVVWKCEGAADYKDLSAGPGCFSEDGSLLAVSFEHIVTLWSSDGLQFKSSLSKYPGHIKQIEFGRESCSHMLVTCSQCDLRVWNLLTFTLQWTAQLEPSMLISDPHSSLMAVLSSNKSLYIFNPMNSEPFHTEKELCPPDKEIFGMIFVPRETINYNAPPWLQKSRLYFINSYQELIGFDEAVDSKNNFIEMIEDEEKPTLFSNLKKVQTISQVEKVQDPRLNHPSKHQYGVVGQTAVNEFLRLPCHTMAPMSTMCSSLLESFSLSKIPVKEKEKKSTDDMEVDDIEMMSDEGFSDSSLSDSEIVKSKSKSPNKKDLTKTKTLVDQSAVSSMKNNLFFIDIDEEISK